MARSFTADSQSACCLCLKMSFGRRGVEDQSTFSGPAPVVVTCSMCRIHQSPKRRAMVLHAR